MLLCGTSVDDRNVSGIKADDNENEEVGDNNDNDEVQAEAAEEEDEDNKDGEDKDNTSDRVSMGIRSDTDMDGLPINRPT